MRMASLLFVCGLLISSAMLSPGIADDWVVPECDGEDCDEAVYWIPSSGSVNYALIDDHDYNTTLGSVYTNESVVTDIYPGGIDDGTWNGPWDNSKLRIRATGGGKYAGPYVDVYYKKGGSSVWVLGISTGISYGEYNYYSSAESSGNWTAGQAEGSDFKLSGGVHSHGLARVEELHLKFWDD